MKQIINSLLLSMIINTLSIAFNFTNAQVTIGSGIAPKNGILLDLKEFDDTTAQAGGRTANKGYMLPRVALTTPNSLTDIPDANDAAIPLQYTGLIVYNIGTDSIVSRGMNIWDGTKWVAMQSSPLSFPLKTYLKAIGGSSISILDVTLILGTDWKKIQFTDKEFDENDEFNVVTSEFTAKQDGIYNIYAQFKASSALISAGNLGIGILKKSSDDDTFTLVAEETFTNITVSLLIGSINVTPPSRKVQTLVKLQADDVIVIAANTTVLSASLLGNSNSYFTIQQVK